MNKEPETYEELIRKKRCIDLLNYYDLSKEEIESIYNFLEATPNGYIHGGPKNICVINKDDTTRNIILPATLKQNDINEIMLSNSAFTVIQRSSHHSNGDSSGGSSNNNNNNNNNNS